jgi:hypothetical protein
MEAKRGGKAFAERSREIFATSRAKKPLAGCFRGGTARGPRKARRKSESETEKRGGLTRLERMAGKSGWKAERGASLMAGPARLEANGLGRGAPRGQGAPKPFQNSRSPRPSNGIQPLASCPLIRFIKVLSGPIIFFIQLSL